MNKTTVFLILALVISTTLGTATALVVPVHLQTSDNVKLYTKQTVVPFDFSNTIAFLELRCDPDDTIVSGYALALDGPFTSEEILNHRFFKDGNEEGFQSQVKSLIDSVTVQMTVVCAKIIPPILVGGIEIQTDTTALLLGYTILNSYWIAPTVVGIGVGIYLVKRKF